MANSDSSMDELHSFTLCHDDWQLIIDSLYESASDRLTRADSIGVDSTYGAILYDDAQKMRALADYIGFFIPDNA